MPIIEITPKEFRLIADLLYKESGILLNDKKRSLVTGRLQKILRARNYKNFRQYYQDVVNDSSRTLLRELIDHLSTNHTFFWREPDHFELLAKQVLPELIQNPAVKKEKCLRFWCAAASSGEEPYTIMFIIDSFFKKKNLKWKYRLLATDISTRILLKAVEGIYSADNVNKLPREFITRYFKKLNAEEYQVKQQIKKRILFKKFNLLEARYPFKRQFQVVFLRNVMIYFDQPTRDGIIEKIQKYIIPGGYLFIGHSETLGKSNPYFEYVQPAVYIRRYE